MGDFWCCFVSLCCGYYFLNCLVLAEQIIPWFVAFFISCSEIIKYYYNTETFTRTSCEDRIKIPRSYITSDLGFLFPGNDNFFSREADVGVIACNLGTQEIFHRLFTYNLISNILTAGCFPHKALHSYVFRINAQCWKLMHKFED